MHNDNYDCPRRLVYLRRENHLTQMKMAEKIGISSSYIALIEVGRRHFTKDLVYRVCVAMHVDPAWMLGKLPLDPIAYASREEVVNRFSSYEAQSLGSRIRRVRVSLGWTCEELGAKVGRRSSSISSYENDRIIPPDKMIAKLSETLGVTSCWLRTGENDSQPYPITKEVLRFLFQHPEIRKALTNRVNAENMNDDSQR